MNFFYFGIVRFCSMADNRIMIAVAAVVVVIVVAIVVAVCREGSVENFSGITRQFPDYDAMLPPRGARQHALLTSPGSGFSGYAMLTTGYASRDVGPNHFSLEVKAGLPLADGGPVRFIYTKQARFPDGEYYVVLENKNGDRMRVAGPVVRLQDGTNRLSFESSDSNKYAGYSVVHIMHQSKDDGQEVPILSGSFS